MPFKLTDECFYLSIVTSPEPPTESKHDDSFAVTLHPLSNQKACLFYESSLIFHLVFCFLFLWFVLPDGPTFDCKSSKTTGGVSILPPFSPLKTTQGSALDPCSTTGLHWGSAPTPAFSSRECAERSVTLHPMPGIVRGKDLPQLPSHEVHETECAENLVRCVRFEIR